MDVNKLYHFRREKYIYIYVYANKNNNNNKAMKQVSGPTQKYCSKINLKEYIIFLLLLLFFDKEVLIEAYRKP